ncbi:MAG: DUF6785 family protein [Armatimonadota bacterium]
MELSEASEAHAERVDTGSSDRHRTDMPMGGVSLRAVLLGSLLIPVNVYWVIVAELRWYAVLTLNPLFVTPVFHLFVLVLLNALLRRFAPRLVFTSAEFVVIYIMLVMSCTIATHDFIINLISLMGWARWFATPTNRWEDTLFPHLPRWLLVWDKDLLEGYFQGNSTFYRLDVVRMWVAPLAFWSLFILVAGWTMLCLNVLFRRAWMDQTRLSFPIVRLPLALTEPFTPGAMMCSRALWIGFLASAGLDLLNGLHEWFPSLPYFQTRAVPIQFTQPPWTAVGWFVRTFYPFAIGLAYLVPLDVSFSCWFFYLFVKAQMVVGYQLGYSNIPDFPYVSEQGIGAWVTFGVLLLYSSRGYLREVFHAVWRGDRSLDAEEPLPYRVALWGALVGLVAFAGFWWLAGMSLLWVMVMVATYFLLALCITRVRAEAGGQHTVWDLEPMRLFRLFDSHLMTPATMSAAALSHWFWRLNRSHIMPSQMESFKLAQEHGIPLRKLVLPILLALAIATVAGQWACLHVLYREGALAKCRGFAVWTGVESFNWLDGVIKSGFKAEANRWGVVGASSLFTLFLYAMRTRFVGFPFHPLGYCIGPGLVWLWLPFLIAWLVKFFVLRYGGLRMYRRTLPFFLGLVLGDYTMGALWSLIGVIWGVPTLQIFH